MVRFCYVVQYYVLVVKSRLNSLQRSKTCSNLPLVFFRRRFPEDCILKNCIEEVSFWQSEYTAPVMIKEDNFRN